MLATMTADVNRLLQKFDKLDIPLPKRRDLLVRSVEEYLILAKVREKKKTSVQANALRAISLEGILGEIQKSEH